MNIKSMEIDYKTHNNYKKALNKDKDNPMEQYKEMICPSCVHYKDIDYQDCIITMKIDGNAGCINYKCKDCCKNKNKKSK